MSALPPKADIGTQSRNVRFVPKADSCTAQLTVKSSHTSRGSCQISPPKLVAHFCFFKGNVDPIRGNEQGYGRTKHWPRADPDRYAKGKYNEAQIHGVAGKLIRTARNKLAIGW